MTTRLPAGRRWPLGAVLMATAGAVGLVAGAAGLGLGGPAPTAGFDHELHAGLFPSCLSCHRGAARSEAPLFPDPAGCTSCHDGRDSLDVVEWAPRSGPRPTNLDFAHDEHAAEVAAEGEATVNCVACHAPEAAAWMTVERAVVSSCLDCHGLRSDHLALADDSCAICHTDLADSPALREEQIAGFVAPPSHEAQDFAFEHAEGMGQACSVCHARDFCVQCHVDAPEQPEIAGLAADARSLALVASVPVPASHEAAGFLTGHGRAASAEAASCASCHTAESCTTCHIGEPQLAAALHAAGPGRGVGALVARNRPASHFGDFLATHGSMAAARPETCAGCHVRSDCTECHRPGAAVGSRFHPGDFLSRHPSAAYARETSCADCHATGEFCTSCHASAGLGSGDVLASSFHDGQAAFSVGHGAPARLSLETCASCHVERDCLACHSSTGGRGIDPHGPGFEAERLRRANPQMCTACHGNQVPPSP